MDDFDRLALQYHRLPQPGKLAVMPTKPMATQRDLALAYSPGVAAASREIIRDPETAAELTGRANLVGVVTNGSAVLGLGNVGPLAAKPVMEGKAALFRKFAGIDVFDIELNADTADAMVEAVAALEPTFGAINLEDIKAPECFEVESRLRDRLSIPVFHDDQHGTAIVVGAAFVNALHLTGRDIKDVTLISTGGGAAGIACLDMLVSLGLPVENVTLYDRHGLVTPDREIDMNPYKARYAKAAAPATPGEALKGADAFLGLSGPGVLKGDMVAGMADKPIIMALANPDPEIMPDEVKAARPDAIVATGRSDFPNQVNNVLCFPFIFRAALDVGATTINEEMKIACVEAVARLARAEATDVVAKAYRGEALRFGPTYILPKPFDPRLIVEIAPAIAKAAMESGVARRPIEDFTAYRARLGELVYRSGQVMRPVMARARGTKRRVVYGEGEDDRVLRCAQAMVDEGIAFPVLLGREDRIRAEIERLGLRLQPGQDVEVIEPIRSMHFHGFANAYWRLMRRHGVTPDLAAATMRSSNTLFGGMMVRRGEADAVICGPHGTYDDHLAHLRSVLGGMAEVGDAQRTLAAMNALILDKGTVFITDTYVNHEPSPEQLAQITRMAADSVRRFGIEPKVALVSHSNFGASNSPSARRMRATLDILWRDMPDLLVEGEMHADAALDEVIRDFVFPGNRLKGAANLLVMPSLDAANIAANMVKAAANALNVGPMLLGLNAPAHIATPSSTVRGLMNLTALAVVEAETGAEKGA